MNVFIVHAHPEPRSFCSSMCSVATEHLRGLGHEVRVSDLYATNFNPVASATDFGQRKNPDYLVYALEQRHGHETGSLAPDIRAEIGKLLWCDMLVLNFPIFWFSTPAMLKGWIDRVLVSGLVYGGKRFYDRGGLTGKRVMVSITIGGQPHMFAPDGIHGSLDDMLRHLLRGTLAYTGMTVLPPFVAWHVPYVSAEMRGQVLQSYRQRLEKLDALEPLTFPRLDDYDSTLAPLQVS
ncbi:MAG: NAD(P)H-dependent oxidoreductase [Proteobacteria bacterium]|nr:NAD(P)H-dependent oxidoreductase [Pseudomonadota bacterium]